ncbi:MAG: hypothetical protein QOJ65_1529 [Fimbriimonadaceae bacterium]|jgi:hypothetical protein|nr:hypothetical protein [Fimbriimonadaceae bacterium]
MRQLNLVLGVLALAAVLGLGYLNLTQGGYARAAAVLTQQAPVMALPRVGTVIDVPKNDYFGRPIPRSTNICIVTVGECRGCTAGHLQLTKLPNPTPYPVVFYFQGKGFPELLKPWKKQFWFVSDEENRHVPPQMYVLAPFAVLVNSRSEITVTDPSSADLKTFLKRHPK